MKFVKYGRPITGVNKLCVDNLENPTNFINYGNYYNNQEVPDGYVPVKNYPIFEMEVRFITYYELVEVESEKKFGLTMPDLVKLLNLIACKEIKVSDNETFIGNFILTFKTGKSSCNIGVRPLDKLDIL